MKMIGLEEMTDKHIGKKSSINRNKFEYELEMSIVGDLVKKIRKQRNLTQEELGEIIGVQKAQISKIETNMKSVRIDTFLKVLEALKAKAKIIIELKD